MYISIDSGEWQVIYNIKLNEKERRGRLENFRILNS